MALYVAHAAYSREIVVSQAVVILTMAMSTRNVGLITGQVAAFASQLPSFPEPRGA